MVISLRELPVEQAVLELFVSLNLIKLIIFKTKYKKYGTIQKLT